MAQLLPDFRQMTKKESPLPIYFGRLIKPQQMDFEQALWIARTICISPKQVYRQTAYHKSIKNQWARDDPGFVVLTIGLIIVTSLVYSIFFSRNIENGILPIIYAVFVDYLALQIFMATVYWFISERFLKKQYQHRHSVDQSVEWLYAFDVCCNSFFPTFILLGVVQLILSPVLLHKMYLLNIVANLLWAVAVSVYFYLNFVGFSCLPFLDKTQFLLVPILVVGIVTVVSILFKQNPTKAMLKFHYG